MSLGVAAVLYKQMKAKECTVEEALWKAQNMPSHGPYCPHINDQLDTDPKTITI